MKYIISQFLRDPSLGDASGPDGLFLKQRERESRAFLHGGAYVVDVFALAYLG